MELKCPRCSNLMFIVKVIPLRDDQIEVRAKCTNCNLYVELTLELEEKRSRQKTTHAIREIPNDAPILIKELFDKANFVSFFHIERYGEQTPEAPMGIDKLAELGIPTKIARIFENQLRAMGIERLYKHQAEAIKAILSGSNALITAPTGTGKTEAFAIPCFTLAYMLKNKQIAKPIVLIIYPTKALARDQLKKLKIYADAIGLNLDVLDGDTSSYRRKKISSNPPEVLITNFDMIHYHLARRTRLSSLFKKAVILVMDEAHMYTGAFGTHVYYILRRLQRFTEGGPPQIVMSSATIHNPEDFAHYYLSNGRSIKIIQGKGRKSPLYMVFSKPLESIYSTIAKFIVLGIEERIKTLAFLNTRRGAEYVLYILNRFTRIKPEIRGRYDIHRAGLPKKIRIEIEESFKKGKKLALVSTPTLELGIDIGDLDLVVSEITPIDNFIQRAGRAGRRGKPGVAVLVLRSDDPISEFYSKYPTEYLRDVTLKYIEPKNEYIAESHYYLMAVEKPIEEKEIQDLIANRDAFDNLVKRGSLVKIGNRYYANKSHFNRYFSRNIRGSDKIVRVYYQDKMVDEREAVIAIRELHPEALYIVRGRKFKVRRLDLNKMIAELEDVERELEGYYTKPLYSYSAEPVKIFDERETLGTTVYYGLFKMKAIVYGYLLYREGEDKAVDERLLDSPIVYTYNTLGITFRAPTVDYWNEEHVAGTYHALEHILIEGTNKVSGGGSDDLGGISFGTTGVIVIYDGTPGGNGVSKLLFDRFELAVERARDILDSCQTEDDERFNKCVYSYRCGNNNKPLYARGALEVLESMMTEIQVEGREETLSLLKVLDKGLV